MRASFTLLIVTFWLSFGIPSAYADVATARAAFKSGDYQHAFNLWLAAAEKGDASAQFNVAIMLENGQGIKRDLFSAAAWYDLAARQKYPHAKDMLDRTLKEIADFREKELLKHLPKADAGDEISQLAVASLYARNAASSEERSEALKWFLLAEEKTENKTVLKRIKRQKQMLINKMDESEKSMADEKIRLWHKLREPIE